MLKRMAVFLCVFVMLTVNVNAVEYKKNDTLSQALSLLLEDNQKPDVSSIGGEWAVIAISRGQMAVNKPYYDSYYGKVKDFIKNSNVSRYTDYSRLILAINAIGEDTLGIEEKLFDYDAVVSQGINGAIFALIALNSKNTQSDVKDRYLDYIINSQHNDGGFGLMEDSSDVDVTAMALQALSFYKDDTRVNDTVVKAVNYINDAKIESSESAAQVVIAFCALNMIPDRYVTELMKYYKDGYFLHTMDGEKNAMATEQGTLALVALNRYENNKNSLYDMRDGIKRTSDNESFGICPFIDVLDADTKALAMLYKKGVINGKTDVKFSPDTHLTRAEMTAIMVRAMSTRGTLDLPSTNYFSDVSNDDWFRISVNTAAMYGIVQGVTKTRFNPNGNIKKEELAIMLTRLCNYFGIDTEVKNYDGIEKYADFSQVSDWAREAVAYCYINNLFNASDTIAPRTGATRIEAARAVSRILWND